MGDVFGLTSVPFLILVLVLAVGSVALIPLVALRKVRLPKHLQSVPLFQTTAARVTSLVALALVAQLMAVMGVFLIVNNHFGLYTSWGDLSGEFGAPPGAGGEAIKSNAIKSTKTNGKAQTDDLTLLTTADGKKVNVLIWLPPQYSDPKFANQKFPVIMFMPGQPGSGYTVFHDFDFENIAEKAITDGRIPPFIAVLPSLMIAPPRDTECTNVPNGPQAESWLSEVVPSYVEQHYRVVPRSKDWSLMGWSTGGFCATKELLLHPTQWSSTVSFGGYYQPLTDGSTGNLFGGSLDLKNQNSPLWLYMNKGGLGDNRLLVVAGKEDKQANDQQKLLLGVTKGDAQVSFIDLPQGGHNFPGYRAYLPKALEWIAAGWLPTTDPSIEAPQPQAVAHNKK